MGDRTVFFHALGLKTPAPLWTAPAFDRCLFLASFYPILSIFLIWAVSGHVGAAEQSLGLVSLPGWQRALALAGVAFLMLASRPAGGAIKFLVAIIIVLGISGLASVWSITFIALALAYLAFSISPAGRRNWGRSLSSVGVVITGLVVIVQCDFLSRQLYALVNDYVSPALDFTRVKKNIIALIYILVLPLREIAVRRRWEGIFFSLFLPTMILTCLCGSYLLATSLGVGRALLLFLGLLNLLNAPFDWASLGLTRALLRRGLELGGWWPYVLALTDAALAAVIITALALTMVVGVQTFDALAVHGGGNPILPLDPLFNGIAASPTAPEYWWLYALLFSTMLPSLLNLVIGGASLVRGLPGVPLLLLRFMPEAGMAVRRFDRTWMAMVLTLQVIGGAILGIAAQVLLVVVIIGYVMPWIGADLLGMARDVAAFNLPARVGHLFGVSL